MTEALVQAGVCRDRAASAATARPTYRGDSEAANPGWGRRVSGHGRAGLRASRQVSSMTPKLSSIISERSSWHRRRLSGVGDLDTADFIAALTDAGWRQPPGRIVSDELRSLPIHRGVSGPCTTSGSGHRGCQGLALVPAPLTAHTAVIVGDHFASMVTETTGLGSRPVAVLAAYARIASREPRGPVDRERS